MLVSVVIPSYNHARFVMKAVDSVLSQSYRKIELVIVDDGSRDESVSLLRSVRDPRMKLHVQENQGAHAAINRGMALAQGDYIAILNSDDEFCPGRISECMGVLEASGADIACTWIDVVDEEGASKGIKRGWQNMRPAWAADGQKDGFWNGDDFCLNLISSNFVSTTSNILMRRSVIDQVGVMRNLRFAHDWDFMLRAAARVPCELVPKPLMKYRLHGANTISTNQKWMMFEVCWVLAANFYLFEGRQLYGGDSVGWQTMATMVRAVDASVQVGGCDRLLWILRQYIDSRRAAGDAAPGEDLLDNAQLRQAFIDLVAGQ